MGRSIELVLLRRDCSELTVDVAISRLTDAVQSWVVVRLRDDGAKKAAALHHDDTTLRLRLSFEDNIAPMVYCDFEDRMIGANDAFCDMVGYTREELLGSDSRRFTHPDDIGITEESHRHAIKDCANNVRYVKRYVRKDGGVIVVDVSRSTARDAAGRFLFFAISERDITEERALSEELSNQALHDPLTGLANRALFQDHLTRAYDRIIRRDGVGAVLLLDLDNFKGVNDAHGHFVGDQLLVAIAHRLERVTQASDTLCRFGGDQFLYLAQELTSPRDAEVIAARLLEVFNEPFAVSGLLIGQRASVGVVHCDRTSASCGQFVQNADIALNEAKRRGKGRLAVFTPSMHTEAVDNFALLQELRHALASGELSMHFQPIVELATTEIVGFEALMRWDHPERGWVSPAVFIPLAEQSEFSLELGAFALRESVTVASTWRTDEGAVGAPIVTVNLSANQFHDAATVTTIEEVLRTSGLAPERLILEITESVTLVDVEETLRVIKELGRLGVRVALDDFGTGYSSLSYLTLLRPAIIKIDRSFVSPTSQNDHTSTLLETIISLGHRLSTTMLAEGIETSEQLAQLRALGCQLGQGFFFSRAVAADKIPELRAHWSTRAQ